MELIPWIAPTFALIGIVGSWWLNRRSAVSDRLAKATADLGVAELESREKYLDRLEKRVQQLEERLDEERDECRKMQEEMEEEIEGLRIKLAAQRRWQEMLEQLLVRHGVQLPPRDELEATA